MIKKRLIEISENFRVLSNSVNEITKASDQMIETLKSGNKIMFCGNGGSASDAQHLAAELIGRYKKDRKPLSGVALTTDTSILTAIGNDFSFDEIFSRQVEAIGLPGDILYAISTSGKSKNIVNAVKVARKKDIKVIGVTGEKPNSFEGICDIIINVPSNESDRIQEMHIAIGQIICEILESKLT
tara:strand:- start:16 stop:570 length:555 start_codon:yes stop_codon:yes gene_type:complete